MEESVRLLVEKDRIVAVITELHYLPNPSGRNTRV
jgi:hypothetical protein